MHIDVLGYAWHASPNESKDDNQRDWQVAGSKLGLKEARLHNDSGIRLFGLLSRLLTDQNGKHSILVSATWFYSSSDC